MKVTYNAEFHIPEKSADLPTNLSKESKVLVDFINNNDQRNMHMEFADARIAYRVYNRLYGYAKRKGYKVSMYKNGKNVFVVKNNE